MAENWRLLYQQMKRMVVLYQDEVVPGLRKVIEDQEHEYKAIISKEKKLEKTMGGWVSAEERLPRRINSDRVLVQAEMELDDDLFFCVARVRNGVWVDEDGLPLEDAKRVIVTHWMPLPEPAKEEQCLPKN